MNLNNERLQFLLKSLANNEISEEELNELSALLENPENNELINSELQDIWNNTPVNSISDIDNDAYLNIVSDARFDNSNGKKKHVFLTIKKNPWFLRVAALILLVSSVALGLYLVKDSNTSIPLNNQTELAANHPIKNLNPNRATLTLSDGRQIILDEAVNGELAKEEHAVISKTEDGQIIYNLSALAKENEKGKSVYNTISTPKGGNYQLILPDGTKVWLNAMSSLKFPAVFTGNDRKVELTGEGYFEVAKNKAKPFFVTAGDATIKVLGTHFNVSAYKDENNIKTTLLEGSVKVGNKANAGVLKPGQQAEFAGASSINIKEVNTDDIMAWKNGYFIFRDEPIQSIMQKISRWYDIDVSYNGDMRGKEFGGKYLKTNSLSELLESLELTGTINFKIEGRRVTVMQ